MVSEKCMTTSSDIFGVIDPALELKPCVRAFAISPPRPFLASPLKRKRLEAANCCLRRDRPERKA